MGKDQNQATTIVSTVLNQVYGQIGLFGLSDLENVQLSLEVNQLAISTVLNLDNLNDTNKMEAVLKTAEKTSEILIGLELSEVDIETIVNDVSSDVNTVISGSEWNSFNPSVGMYSQAAISGLGGRDNYVVYSSDDLEDQLFCGPNFWEHTKTLFLFSIVYYPNNVGQILDAWFTYHMFLTAFYWTHPCHGHSIWAELRN